MSRSAIGWAAAIVLAGAGLAGAAEAPSTAEILAILYPGGQMTFDDEGHHVIRGGAHAVGSAIGPGTTDKVVNRVTWLSGPVVTPDRDDGVALVEAYNRGGAPSCCEFEVMLGVIAAGDGEPRLVWSQRIDQYTRFGQVSLVSAKTDGTKQILPVYGGWDGNDVWRKAILFATRPAGPWRGIPGLADHLEPVPPGARFVPVWIGYVELNPPNPVFAQPRFPEIDPVRFVGTIQFSHRTTDGWRDLIEIRMVSMLLGKEYTPPLVVRAAYRFRPGEGYAPQKRSVTSPGWSAFPPR